MMTSLAEIALTDEEIDQILRGCAGRALLIGGQALAFWAQHYRVRPVGVLAASVTSDADFIGTAQVARDLWRRLRALGWKYWQPAADDATAQTAKLSRTVAGQGIKQIDFLGSAIGLATESVTRRAAVLALADGTRLWVLHPLDVLESRLQNLAQLPVKRNAQGVAQAHLAVEIVRCHLDEALRQESPRRFFDAVERVARLAQHADLAGVLHDYQFDLLGIVPIDRVPSDAFRARRWPQLQEAVDQRRRAYAQTRERQAAPARNARRD